MENRFLRTKCYLEMLNLGHTRTMPWHGLARERTLPRRQMALGGDIPEKATNSWQRKKHLTFLTGSLQLPPKCRQGKYAVSRESAEVGGKLRGGHERREGVI